MMVCVAALHAGVSVGCLPVCSAVVHDFSLLLLQLTELSLKPSGPLSLLGVTIQACALAMCIVGSALPQQLQVCTVSNRQFMQ